MSRGSEPRNRARFPSSEERGRSLKMNHRKNLRHYFLLHATTTLLLLLAGVPLAGGQQPSASPSVSASNKPYLVGWVYKVKWGHADEFWQIFKTSQITVLTRAKALGYV